MALQSIFAFLFTLQVNATGDSMQHYANRCSVVGQMEKLMQFTPVQQQNLSFCLGYFTALREVQDETQSFPGICIPGSVSNGQAVLVFLKFADTHPERLHLNGVTQILTAWREAFPCSQPQRR
jgi:hypothetical protein